MAPIPMNISSMPGKYVHSKVMEERKQFAEGCKRKFEKDGFGALYTKRKRVGGGFINK